MLSNYNMLQSFIVGIFPLFFHRNYNQRDEKKSSGKEMRLVIVVGLLAVTVIALIVALTLQMAVFRQNRFWQAVARKVFTVQEL